MADVTFTDVIAVEVLDSNFSDDRISALSPDHVFVTFKVSAPVFAWLAAPLPGSVTALETDPSFYLPDLADAETQEAVQDWHGRLSGDVSIALTPQGVMKTCAVSCSGTQLMGVLGLRPSPIAEVRLITEGFERFLAEECPLTYRGFIENGRCAP